MEKGEFASGATRVTADGPIGGVLRLESPEMGRWSLGASVPLSGFIVPAMRSASGQWSTGVAIASIGSEVNLRLALRDESGMVVLGGEKMLPLGPNEQISQLLDDLFAEAETQEFRGTLTVTAQGGEIVGAVLQIGPKPHELISPPVKEVK